MAMKAEQVARSEPTDRSMWRVTMMNTMPVAMIATETVWIVRLKMFRGVRKRPSVIDVEDEAEDDEGADHAEEPRVELERLEEAPLPGLGGGRLCRVGHRRTSQVMKSGCADGCAPRGASADFGRRARRPALVSGQLHGAGPPDTPWQSVS
jgi:hypothetical protein